MLCSNFQIFLQEFGHVIWLIHRLKLEYIYKNILPLSSVEHESFHEFSFFLGVRDFIFIGSLRAWSRLLINEYNFFSSRMLVSVSPNLYILFFPIVIEQPPINRLVYK